VVFYLDTSAFLKLLIDETESAAMRAWFTDGRSFWSSQLLLTEAMRAAQRLGVDRGAVEQALDGVSLVMPNAATFHQAATVLPPELRSLDALHLATAVELGADLEAVVAYDARLIAGAHAAGLSVVSPA
jgi:hypothetical protein